MDKKLKNKIIKVNETGDRMIAIKITVILKVINGLLQRKLDEWNKHIGFSWFHYEMIYYYCEIGVINTMLV